MDPVHGPRGGMGDPFYHGKRDDFGREGPPVKLEGDGDGRRPRQGREDEIPRGREESRRSYDERSERKSERSPSPLPDFGNINVRWTGWDKPVSRYGMNSAPQPQGRPGGGYEPMQNRQPQNFGSGVVPRQQKRLYVGNLPPRLSEAHFVDFLNASMKKVPGVLQDPDAGNPIIGLDMSNERTYCFIEFRTPDEATYFTAFDGLTYEGHSLRIHRPREFVATGMEPQLPVIPPSALGIVSTTVPDGPNKIFIGGLPTHFNEAEVKEILGAIGPLKAFNLVRDSQGHSKGFAFCEYVDPELTDVVCQSFNGRKYGDRQLVVQRSQPGQKGSHQGGGVGPGEGGSGDERGNGRAAESGPSGPGPNGQAQNQPQIVTGPDGIAVLAPEGENPNFLFQSMLNSSVPTDILTNTIVAKAKENTVVLQPTNILVLLNAVDTTEEWTDDYYNAVCQDMYTEGSRYGPIVRLFVPRAAPKPKKRKVLLMPGELSESDVGAEGRKEPAEVPPPPGHGRVYIEYGSVDHARAALAGMAGRKYDGRMLLSSFVKSLP